MPREIFHIYGPLAIHWYGVMILVGLLIFIWRASKNPLRKKNLSESQFINLITYSIIAGIVGGRLLNVMSEWKQYQWFDLFAIWEGGFSILGTVCAVAVFVPLYLWYQRVPFLPVLDLIALYSPLLQAIARIGCFLAGCCHGITTTLSWAVTCDNPLTPGMTGTLVHPTQLYSAAALLCIFLIQRYCIYPATKRTGTLLASYLILIGCERFIIDFWRGYRSLTNLQVAGQYISIDQLVAVGIVTAGIGMLVYLSVRPGHTQR